MIYGNRETFAVEIELNENYGGKWLFGKICYWIKGERIGNFEEGTSLRDVLSMMKWIIYDKGKRDGGIFCKLSSEEVFYLIDDSIYGSGEPDDGNKSDLTGTTAVFDVAIRVDVLIELKLYLIQCNSEDRLVYKTKTDTGVNTLSLVRGTFDEIMKQVNEYLDELHEKAITFS